MPFCGVKASVALPGPFPVLPSALKFAEDTQFAPPLVMSGVVPFKSPEPPSKLSEKMVAAEPEAPARANAASVAMVVEGMVMVLIR